LLKTPECKKYIQYSGKFLGQLCFSEQAQSCSKILNDKKHIQYSENFQGNSVFRASASCQYPECKKYIQYSEKFLVNSVFSGQAQVPQKS